MMIPIEPTAIESRKHKIYSRDTLGIIIKSVHHPRQSLGQDAGLFSSFSDEPISTSVFSFINNLLDTFYLFDYQRLAIKYFLLKIITEMLAHLKLFLYLCT
jgi:hypothetical protein